MGHEQASTTLNRYTHVPADTHARVRAALNAAATCSPPASVRAADDGRRCGTLTCGFVLVGVTGIEPVTSAV
jgi:hypothetical protein